MKSFSRIPIVHALLFTLLLSGSAAAQYSGVPGSATPSYGSGKAIGIGVGAAAVGAGALYLTLRHRGSLSGCVLAGDNDAPLTLVDDKKHQTYSLVFASGLTPGERVALRGTRSKDGKGAQTFRVSKVVKNLGVCNTQSAVASR